MKKALSIKLNTPDWCWNKPRKDGSKTWRKNKYTEMADNLKWCSRRHLETCLEDVGIEMISASGGCCDFVYSANIADDFVLNTSSKVLKAKNVTLKDSDGNVSYLKSFFSNIENNEFYGKDIKINFSNKSFGNSLNEPRLYGNILEFKDNNTIVSKGNFTTCQKRDGCPPWSIKAKKIVHDREKKIINYSNAWLEVYEKPIIYFPKFFHPDPTVKGNQVS